MQSHINIIEENVFKSSHYFLLHNIIEVEVREVFEDKLELIFLLNKKHLLAANLVSYKRGFTTCFYI